MPRSTRLTRRRFLVLAAAAAVSAHSARARRDHAAQEEVSRGDAPSRESAEGYRRAEERAGAPAQDDPRVLAAGGQRSVVPVPAAPAEAAAVSVDEDVLFLTAAELGPLIRRRQVSPVELTEAYLDRIRRYGPRLNAFATVMADQALAEARAAEKEINSGRYRSPLHGIPYGAKDLLAARGAPTTWGAAPAGISSSTSTPP